MYMTNDEAIPNADLGPQSSSRRPSRTLPTPATSEPSSPPPSTPATTFRPSSPAASTLSSATWRRTRPGAHSSPTSAAHSSSGCRSSTTTWSVLCSLWGLGQGRGLPWAVRHVFTDEGWGVGRGPFQAVFEPTTCRSQVQTLVHWPASALVMVMSVWPWPFSVCCRRTLSVLRAVPFSGHLLVCSGSPCR